MLYLASPFRLESSIRKMCLVTELPVEGGSVIVSKLLIC
jgi:hypothetical protein